MKIEIELDYEHNEATSYPYWLILNPRQSLRPGNYEIASMITGPFFSRKEAEDELAAARYNYGKHAVVWCFSGCYSGQYAEAIKEARKKERETQ